MAYTETHEQFGEYSKLTVRHEVSGTEMTIIPERGARLNDFLVKMHGETVGIIAGYSDAELSEDVLSSKSALLAPFPNRVADGRYEWRGQEYQLDINREKEQNAIHGFVSNQNFELISSGEIDDYYELVLECASEGAKGYPFPFLLTVTYRFGGVWLEVATELKNTGKTVIPAGFGWHPYYTVAGNINNLQLVLPEVEEIEVDERMIPTGKKVPYTTFSKPDWIAETQLDTGFRLLSPQREVQLYDKERGLTVTVSLEGDGNQYDYLQLYTPPDRESIAIEPMTCAADAFNNGFGLKKLKPGESLRAHFTTLVS